MFLHKFENNEEKLTLATSNLMDAEDFAITRGRIITLNGNAYRDIEILQEEYQELVDEGFFVKGTDWHAIIHHEFGHVVANVYGIDPLKIACEITGLSALETIQFVIENLSEYAGKYKDGSEIISEVFADVSAGTPKKFSIDFYNKVLDIVRGELNE